MKTEILDLFGESIKIKQPISRELLAESLFENMSELSLEQLVGLITNRFTEIIEYADLSNGGKSCQKTSLLFNPHRLSTIGGKSKKSIYEALKEKSFISGLARASLFKKEKVSELLYQIIQLGVNGVQYVNEFPPSNCRDLLKEYNVGEESKVLDPCAGWGGRMIGTSVVSNNYTCFEPSSKTTEGLTKLLEFINTMNKDFKAEINCLPFEDSKLEDNTYDFALTSPPYYDTEKYSDEETNSLNRYKTFDEWVNSFYLPLIYKTMEALKPNKTFILNIGSRKYPLSQILVDNFSKDYKITKKGNYLSGNAGLGKEGEGEMFYAITKGDI